MEYSYSIKPSAGKLGAMVAHCAEDYWLWLIKRNLMKQDGRVHVSFDLDREIYDDYLNGRITKTICEAKRSKFSPFASYTGLSPFRMMLHIPSVRSFSFIRIRNFGLFVTLFEGDSLRIFFAPL